MGTNISIVGQNAVATAANVTYWMGADKFYAYDGRVQTLPCSLRQHVFANINIDQIEQTIAGTNEGFSEVWWFYCSGTSTTVNSYVVYNYAENIWYYGTLARTAWLDSPLRYYPIAAGYSGQLFYHENGVDDGSTNPPSAMESFIQSADFDIGEGAQLRVCLAYDSRRELYRVNRRSPTGYVDYSPASEPRRTLWRSARPNG